MTQDSVRRRLSVSKIRSTVGIDASRRTDRRTASLAGQRHPRLVSRRRAGFFQLLPDDFARRLFRMSSPLPPPMYAQARQGGFGVSANTRGFVFNADLASVVRFLDIGTRVDFKNISR